MSAEVYPIRWFNSKIQMRCEAGCGDLIHAGDRVCETRVDGKIVIVCQPCGEERERVNTSA